MCRAITYIGSGGIAVDALMTYIINAMIAYAWTQDPMERKPRSQRRDSKPVPTASVLENDTATKGRSILVRRFVSSFILTI